MTWVTDYFDSGTYGTKTTTLTAGMQTYYDKKFLNRAVNMLQLVPLGQKRRLPKGEGKVIEFFRYNNIAVSVSSATLTEGINPNATLITGQKLQATLKEYGGFSQHASLLKDTHIDRNLAGVSELWGEHAANIIDLVTAMEVCSNGCYPLRGDANTTYLFSGVVDSATTTTLVDATLETNTNYGDTNDDLNQSVVIITSGTGYGQARACTDYVASGGSITVSPAWDTTPAAGDTFIVTSADSTLTNQGLTTTNISEAVRILRNNRAMTYDGYLVGLICPDTEKTLKADTNWVNVMQYSDGVGRDGLFTGEVGKWGGVRFISTTQPFRFPQTTIGTAGTSYGPGATGANYSASGAVYSNLIMGKEAFGVTTFTDEGNMIRPGIIAKSPGPGDTSNPLNRFSTVGWAMPFVAKALNPMWAVNIWTTK